MAGVSPLNNALLVSQTLSEGNGGAAVPRDAARRAAVPPSSGNASVDGASFPTRAVGPLTETPEVGRPDLDLDGRPAFRVTISPAAARLAQGAGRLGTPAVTDHTEGSGATAGPEGKQAAPAQANGEGRVPPEGETPSEGRRLSETDRREVEELRRQDRRVRQHEQAHVAAGGRYVRGGARYEYTTGPNGRRYATGGEVPIDLSTEKDPQVTLQKMNTVRRAALAPADPSAADRAIAASATRKAVEARREVSEERTPGPVAGSTEPGGVGRSGHPVRDTVAAPAVSRTADGTDSEEPSGQATGSASDSSGHAILKAGLFRALSRVTAPPPQGPNRIDRYA